MPIRDEQIMGLANKAVRGYVNKQFAKYFTKEEVEDMVADVALRIVKARDKFDEERGCLNAWVYTIAMNVVKTAGKAKSNRTAFAERIEDMEETAPIDITYEKNGYVEEAADEDLMRREMVSGFYAKLRSERDKRFLGWQIEGLSAEEMAKKEGTTVQNVYMILHHMRQRLRAQRVREAA